MALLPATFWMPRLRHRERQTLNCSYAGEFGRGIYLALTMEFALVVARTCFGVRDTRLIWLLASAGFIGMIGALFVESLTALGRKKTLILAVEAGSRLLAVAAALTTSGAWFAVVMASGIALNSFSIPLISSLYGINFRQSTRGRAVGRLQTLSVGATTLAALLLTFAFDTDPRLFRFMLVTASLASLACSVAVFRGLPEPARRASAAPRARLKDLVDVLWRDHAFVYIEVYWFIIGIANLWLVPIRVLYLEQAGFGGGDIVLATTTVASATALATTGIWGRYIYSFNFASIRITQGLLFIAGILCFFYSRSLPMVCLGTMIWSIGLAGGNLSWRLLATFFTTPARVASYMCVHVFLCGVRGVIGPMISLKLHESHSPQLVAWISVSGFVLAILMLIPFRGVIERRQAQLGRCAA